MAPIPSTSRTAERGSDQPEHDEQEEESPEEPEEGEAETPAAAPTGIWRNRVGAGSHDDRAGMGEAG